MTSSSVILSAVVMGLAACSGGDSKKLTDAKGGLHIIKDMPDNLVLAEFKGGKVTAADLKAQMAPYLTQVNEEVVSAVLRNAEQIAMNRIMADFAKSQGHETPDKMLEKMGSEVKIFPEQVEKYMKDNKLDKGQKDPKTGKVVKYTKAQVQEFLKAQILRGSQIQLVRNLRAESGLSLKVDLPRYDVPPSVKETSIGPANAPVVIHEFASFQCQFCAAARQTVGRVLQEYGTKVKYVYRHLPLADQPESGPAAIAAICAAEQGKFWEAHDYLFSNQTKLAKDVLAAMPATLKIDTAKFSACLSDELPKKVLQADIQAALKVGVGRTPTFLVNGRKVVGNVAFEDFKALVDQELERAGIKIETAVPAAMAAPAPTAAGTPEAVKK